MKIPVKKAFGTFTASFEIKNKDIFDISIENFWASNLNTIFDIIRNELEEKGGLRIQFSIKADFENEKYEDSQYFTTKNTRIINAMDISTKIGYALDNI